MSREVKLSVNDVPIALEGFVAAFIQRTVAGMIASLKDTATIKTLSLTIAGDKMSVVLNGEKLPVNAFVSLIFRNTVFGMVSPLKGVGDTISQVVITIGM